LSCTNINADKIQMLINLGLTHTQAKVYLALCSFGDLNAKKVSIASKTPRQDAYRVLNELFTLGLVEKFLKKPVEFRAIPLHKGLNLLLQRRNEETRELKKESLRLIGRLNSLPLEEAEKEHKIVLVSSKETILTETEKLLFGVRESLDIISSPRNLFPWILIHQKLFENALNRKVKIRCITMPTKFVNVPKPFNSVSQNKNYEIRLISNYPTVSFGIYDKKNVILELSAKKGFLKSELIVSDNPCLVELAISSFEGFWNRADDISVNS
jgi:sugar-specific transcriptional regulator TrmB